MLGQISGIVNSLLSHSPLNSNMGPWAKQCTEEDPINMTNYRNMIFFSFSLFQRAFFFVVKIFVTRLNQKVTSEFKDYHSIKIQE